VRGSSNRLQGALNPNISNQSYQDGSDEIDNDDEIIGGGMVNPNGPRERTLRHMAVIMDGNRRYGKRIYGDGSGGGDEKVGANDILIDLPKNYLRGHYDGGLKLESFIRWCVAFRNERPPSQQLKFLTVYAFSTENYGRSRRELDALHAIFLRFTSVLEEKAEELNLRVNVYSTDGLAGMPENVSDAFKNLVNATSSNTGLILNICAGYGGRMEILNAVKAIATEATEEGWTRERIAGLKEEDFERYLEGGRENRSLPHRHTFLQGSSQAPPPPTPDPVDVVVRTSGECRLSNFLIWQVAYSELFFLKKTWPEVRVEDFRRIVDDFESGRNRRFGL